MMTRTARMVSGAGNHMRKARSSRRGDRRQGCHFLRSWRCSTTVAMLMTTTTMPATYSLTASPRGAALPVAYVLLRLAVHEAGLPGERCHRALPVP